ncbi:hypothetical protein O181_055355 [Austropuccinia psidii MF-1]|uniref:Retrotransposon gag domain-containing protein n=1 Tax=Austropuccinia psidii MF-1 TaxID=1389203 RepID=A0A9Q3E458_9BASI|nr:hypothetical protein [Austropuccinia psidii MF-1]
MPVHNSPPAKNTRSQRNPAVFTPTVRVPLYCTPSVYQPSENLYRGPPTEGKAPSRRGGMKSRRSRSFSGLFDGYPGMSEEEDSGEAEVVDALANPSEVPQDSNLAPTNQPLVFQPDPSPLKIMEQTATIIRQLSQEAAPGDNPKAPSFKTPSMKAPYSFYDTQVHKLRGFIQSCQLIFHNDPANFFSDRNKVLYSTCFLTGRAGKWIEPYLLNISNEDPSYLLNNWQLFETQLFTLFGDPNEFRKAEQELENLRMKESGHVSFYIADFRSLISSIGDWGERAYIHVYRNTRYHERQKEKGSHQEKKPPVTGSNSSRPPQD